MGFSDDDFSSGFSGFKLFGGDTPDIGVSPTFDFGSASQFGLGAPPLDPGPAFQFGGPLRLDPGPEFQFGRTPTPAPTLSPFIGAGLGALGPLAGLIGQIAGGGVTGASRPQLTTQQKALQGQGTQALGALSPFITGTTPLQQQQAGILNPLSQYIQSLLSGQGLQGLIGTLSPLIQQAFSPFAQGLATQATEAGRRAGFHDAPGTSPVGSAILGPGLAQLQGQEAQSLLQALFQQIPQAAISGVGAFNQPINQQIGAAGTQASGFGSLIGPVGTQQTQPLGTQIGQGLASAIGGAGVGLNAALAQSQQQEFRNSLLNLIQQQGIGGASGLPLRLLG